MDASRFKVLRELASRIDLEDLERRVTMALETHPQYGRYARAHPDAAVVNAENIRIFSQWLTEDRPPGEADLEFIRAKSRERAVEGVPLEDLIATYRFGMRFGWNAMLESADPSELGELIGAADRFFEHVEVISDAVTEAYSQVKEGAPASSDRRSRELLAALLDHSPLNPEMRRIAADVGFSLAESYVPFALSIGDEPLARYAEAARSMRERGFLAIVEGARIVGFLPDHSSTDVLGWAPLAVIGDPAPRGALAPHLADVRRALSIAASMGRGGLTRTDELLPAMLLAATPNLARSIERAVFGALSEPEHQELSTTLERLAEHGFDRSAAAAALPVHRNTMTYRIRRISTLTGLDLSSPETRTLVWLAVRSRRLDLVHDAQATGESSAAGP